jgi:hypothetical protein
MEIKDIKLNQWYDVSDLQYLTGWYNSTVNYIKIKEVIERDDDYPWYCDCPVNLVCFQLLYIPGDEYKPSSIRMGEDVIYNIEMKLIDKLLSKPVDYPNIMPILTKFLDENEIRRPYDEIFEKG